MMLKGLNMQPSNIVSKAADKAIRFRSPSSLPPSWNKRGFSETSKPALGTTQPHMKWILEILFRG